MHYIFFSSDENTPIVSLNVSAKVLKGAKERLSRISQCEDNEKGRCDGGGREDRSETMDMTLVATARTLDATTFVHLYVIDQSQEAVNTWVEKAYFRTNAVVAGDVSE